MFNVGREFNKIASTQGAGFFGALPQASRRQELRFAGDSLRNIAKVKAAKEGIAMAEAEGAANRRNSLINSIIGGIGNIASSGISAAIKNSQTPQLPNYAAESTPVTMGQITSPASWSQGSQAVQGMYDSGFSWQQPIDYSVNLPGGGLSGLGKNPYSINTTGW